MAGDPADIRSAPEHVGVLETEHPFGRGIHLRQVATGRVENAFRLAGRARRIEDVERIFRIHRFGGAFPGRARHQLRPPQVATGLERHRLARPTQHHDVLDAGRRRQRVVDVLFQRHNRAAAIAAIRRDQHLRARVVDPVAQRFCGEAAKYDSVNRADTRAREHRDGDFGDHREIDRDAVTAPHAQALQHVRELVDVGVQLPVGDAPDLAWRLSLPDQRHAAAPAGADMPVEAIHRCVELAAQEPFRVRWLPLQHAIPRPAPFQLLRPVRPITFRVLPGAVVRHGVPHVGLGFEGFGRREAPLLVEERFDPVSRHD